jgi:hypothetical protein
MHAVATMIRGMIKKQSTARLSEALLERNEFWLNRFVANPEAE